MMAGMEYCVSFDESYISRLVERMGHPCVVMTGVAYEEGKTGILLLDEGRRYHYSHDRIEQNFHGTGDMFAACFTGALLQGKQKEEAVRIAANFVKESISISVQRPAHWYGVRFESALPGLVRMLREPTE